MRCAGVSPATVCYVEAHGTGTSAGDRAEAEAIGTVFRVETGCSSELLVGSAKSNMGHTEAAAGICGLMKAALWCKAPGRSAQSALRYAQPGHRARTPSSPARAGYGDASARRSDYRACVNSIRFGGSNAAVVIRGATDLECARAASPEPRRSVPPATLGAVGCRLTRLGPPPESMAPEFAGRSPVGRPLPHDRRPSHPS